MLELGPSMEKNELKTSDGDRREIEKRTPENAWSRGRSEEHNLLELSLSTALAYCSCSTATGGRGKSREARGAKL